MTIQISLVDIPGETWLQLYPQTQRHKDGEASFWGRCLTLAEPRRN